MGHFPIWNEVELFPLYFKLLARGQKLVFPRVRSEEGKMTLHQLSDLSAESEIGAFGIREPLATLPEVSKHDIDVALIPGLAFTESGYRLGRGGGFYDRFLAGFKGTRIAACYEEQVLPHVPYADHDEPVGLMITPRRAFAATSG